MKYIPPSIKESAFNCPHCHALAAQQWFDVYAESKKGNEVPEIIAIETIREFREYDFENYRDWERAQRLAKDLDASRVAVELSAYNADYTVHFIKLSRCFNCRGVSVWLADELLYPRTNDAPSAAADMPADVKRDYSEAASILDASPRGSAALLRLAVQRLCKHLGEPGENINKDIGSLVSKGLDLRVQRALDIVRVVGNNAVHPGQIALDDDRGIAVSLFQLVNLIVERMISEPKQIEELFLSLPGGALNSIEKRDKNSSDT